MAKRIGIERGEKRSGRSSSRSRSWTYWAAVLALTLANLLVLGATSAIAGFAITAFTGPSSELIIINMAAMTVLFWPTAACAMRGFAERRTLCLWGAAIHAAGVVLLMEAYFGKPSGLLDGSVMAQSLPTLIALGLTAWITVEWRVHRVARVCDNAPHGV